MRSVAFIGLLFLSICFGKDAKGLSTDNLVDIIHPQIGEVAKQYNAFKDQVKDKDVYKRLIKAKKQLKKFEKKRNKSGKKSRKNKIEGLDSKIEGKKAMINSLSMKLGNGLNPQQKEMLELLISNSQVKMVSIEKFKEQCKAVLVVDKKLKGCLKNTNKQYLEKKIRDNRTIRPILRYLEKTENGDLRVLLRRVLKKKGNKAKSTDKKSGESKNKTSSVE
jgi:hypothetical protein